jgi:hypothetical protein
MCHQGLQFCDISAKKSLNTRHAEGFLKSLQAYPDDEDSILATWEDRSRIWEDVDRKGTGRVVACRWAKEVEHRISANSY